MLIGVGALIMLFWNGKIAGISGITKGLLYPRSGEWGWRFAFVAGLLVGGAAYLLIDPAIFSVSTNRSMPVIALGGVLVGFGTVMANGCTSGHGVCGVSRLSRRSILATLTFVGMGFVTVALYNALAG